MVDKKWLLQTLSELLEEKEPPVQDNLSKDKSSFVKARQKADREWSGAIAALENLLWQTFATCESKSNDCQGLVLSGTAPVLTNLAVLSQINQAVFTPEMINPLALMPGNLRCCKCKQEEEKAKPVLKLPLLPADPLSKEQFCLVFTAKFALVMVLGSNSKGYSTFQFSFDPETIEQAWRLLKPRLLFTAPHHLNYFQQLVEQFTPSVPDYRMVTQFSRQLLHNLPESPTIIETRPVTHESELEVKTVSTAQVNSSKTKQVQENNSEKSRELELLQALTHEIRTPLTTIRMLTRSLLKKRCQLDAKVVKRLETIDQECTEQIKRMELIFKAIELESTANKQEGVQLTAVPLEQILQQSMAHWQKQAQRRNVTLEIKLPEKLPTVVSNPAMLDQVLTGLLENFTRNLPTGGQAEVQITTAGNQLKLQLLSDNSCDRNPFKALGQLLMFQPETGSLTLNLNVTKNLFQALGGKLTVRQRPQQGEIMTVFLPLNSSQPEITV